MTKAKISEYDAVAANNTDVNGVNIDEGCAPSGMNNMGREIMAALKRFETGADGDSLTVGGNLIVSGTVTAANTATLGNVDVNGGTIDGAVIGGSTAAAGSFTTLNTSGQVVFNDAGADVDFRVESDTDENALFVDGATGNIGIGTAGYGSYNSARKNISLGEGATIAAANSGGDPNLTLCSNAFLTSTPDYKYIVSDFASQYEQYNGTHTWSNAPSGTAGNTITFTPRMAIDSSGNLLVGGSTPIETFAGIPSIQGVTNCIIVNKRDGTGSQSQIRFHNANGNVGGIDTSGSSTVYATSSDYRLKENVVPMTGALAKVLELSPVTYTWKVDGSSGEGFIAHELQAVCPDAVSGEKDKTEIRQVEVSPAVPATYDEEGNELTPAVEAVYEEREVPVYQGVDTSFLVATLTAAIQELKAELDEAKTRIAALEGQ
jgi:hypothetical protein